MTDYKVFCVAYQDAPGDDFAVAISAESEHRALAHLCSCRHVLLHWMELVRGREPLAPEERIEGTIDLKNPQAPPPRPGSDEAAAIMASNATLMRQERRVG